MFKGLFMYIYILFIYTYDVKDGHTSIPTAATMIQYEKN